MAEEGDIVPNTNLEPKKDDWKFEETLAGKRVRAFFDKNKDRYELEEEDYNIIGALFKEKSLKSFDDVTMKARSRFQQRHVPFMEAVYTVVEDNTKASVWQRMGRQQGIKAVGVRAEDPQLEAPIEGESSKKEVDLTGLERLLNRIGWRTQSGKFGGIAQPPIPKGSASREDNFRRSMTDPNESEK